MKEKYEVSIWEDILVPKNTKIINGEEITIPAHYEEKKVAIISSNNISSSMQAFNLKLTTNINGTNLFEFQMYHMVPQNQNFNDLTVYLKKPQAREKKDSNNKNQKNPLRNLLFAERKIKLLWQDKWYDFVIKEIEEDKVARISSFKCIDSYVNELSRTGYNITFDTELKNNFGTASELIKQTIKGTDWTYDKDHSDLLQEWSEEPVYEVGITQTIDAFNQVKKNEEELLENSKILVYYSQIQDILNSEELQGEVELQFAYALEYKTDFMSPLVINADCYVINTFWEKVDSVIQFYLEENLTWLKFPFMQSVSNQYRAKRLVKKQKSILDPIIGRYVNIYEAIEEGDEFDIGDVIYGYSESLFTTPNIVQNLVINNRNFTSVDGWSGENIFFSMYPQFSPQTQGTLDSFESHSFLKFESGKTYYNKGITSSSHLLEEGLQKEQEYIVRFKIKGGANEPSGGFINSGLTPSLQKYDDDGLYIKPSSPVKVFGDIENLGKNGDWLEYKITILESIPRVKLRGEKVGLFFTATSTVWLQEVEFFPLVYGEDEFGNLVKIVPEALNTFSIERTQYTYYNFTTQKNKTQAKELEFLWQSTVDWQESKIIPVYNEDFEKARILSISGSNRFNILQSIAETMEGWIVFEVKHEPTGKLVYDEYGLPIKTIKIVKEIGKDTGLSFVYGLDLKTINRTYQSNEISTKTIVLPNTSSLTNENIITIAKAKENYPMTSYIMNFDYYIAQGLIDIEELNKDLYDKENGIGFYEVLRENSINHQKESGILSARKIELVQVEANIEVYSGIIQNAQIERQNIQNALIALAGTNSWESAQPYIKTHSEEDTIKSRVITLLKLENDLEYYQGVRQEAEDAYVQLNNIIQNKENTVKECLDNISIIEEIFNKKYAQFIQEGVWQDSQYIDESLYYLDGQAIASRSAKPEVAYTIFVLRLSILEDFKHKIFKVGDVARIEDREFFGTLLIDYIETPIKEKVVISEITYFLDNPSQDIITIQNYRTQFEDLFQRIVSNVQQLQFASGDYNTVAGAFGLRGAEENNMSNLFLNPHILENSFIASTATIGEAFIGRGHLKDAIIDNAKITNAAITGDKIAANSIETQHLTADAIIANMIKTGQLQSLNGELWLNLDNGYFSLRNIAFDENGFSVLVKDPISNNVLVNIDKTGLVVEDGAITVKDANNTSIITSQGLKVMFVYTSSGELNGFQKIGIWNEGGVLLKHEAFFSIDVPAKLTITKAELKTFSIPTYKTGYSFADGFYHSRNLSLYRKSIMDGFIDSPYPGSYSMSASSGGTNVTSAVWGQVWSPSGNGIQEKIGNITNILTTGKNSFTVRTSDPLNMSSTDRYNGGMQFSIVVEGYLQG